jgi:cytochrome c biogenesis protein CcdA
MQRIYLIVRTIACAVRSLIAKFNAWIYARRLERMLLTDPPWWRVLLAAIWAVAIFWAVAVLVVMVSIAAHLYLNSKAPLVVGGIIISLIALLFATFINAEASFIDWLERLTRRLMPNEQNRDSQGYTEVNRIIRKWRTKGATFRNTIIVSNLVLFLIGVALALL